MKLTPKKAAMLTYQMWSWLADNPGKRKHEYPRYEKDNFGDMIGRCAFCDLYTVEDEIEDRECGICPIILVNKRCAHEEDDSLYDEWDNNLVNPDTRAWAAKSIAVIALKSYLQEVEKELTYLNRKRLE